jgi:hypothetical protein
MLSFYSAFEKGLEKELKYINEAIDDLDILNIEVNFNIHMGTDNKAREVNPLAWRRLRIEKLMVQSILKKDVKSAERLYDLYIEMSNQIRKQVEEREEIIVDHDNNVIENGEKYYLDELLEDIAKYTVCIKLLKEFNS